MMMFASTKSLKVLLKGVQREKTVNQAVHGLRRFKATAAPLSVAPKVKIVEVGPRDGLQNESQTVLSVEEKVKFITQLAEAGCRRIETGSFVSPKWVPAMANTLEVMQKLATWKEKQHAITSHANVSFSCLVPNLKGWEQASTLFENSITSPAVLDEIAVFGAASETFSQRNIACSIEESMQRFRSVTDAVRTEQPNVKIRGYLSCVVGCPYEGRIAPSHVAKVAEQMMSELNCDELSLGDTIGVGTPAQTVEMLEAVTAALGGSDKLAVHFHDTYGQALANILIAMDRFDIGVIDSSVAGLGGCPYAKGASGNVATEDVVYMLEGLGVETGIDLNRLAQVGDFISNTVLKKTGGSRSKAGQALMAASDADATKSR